MTSPVPFVLPGADGLPHNLSEQTGHPLLLVFFKTSCSTCRLSFPYLERFYAAYRAQGFQVWGISQSPLDSSLAFAVDTGATFPVLLDSTWDVSESYEVVGVPTFTLVDSSGQIAYRSASFSKEDLNEMSRLVAAETHSAQVEIAPANDGKPAFRPG
jgi:peroxiredoxin